MWRLLNIVTAVLKGKLALTLAIAMNLVAHH